MSGGQRRPRQVGQPAPWWETYAPAVLSLAGLLLGAGMLRFGLPGAALAWLFVLAGAWIAPPAQLTGKTDSAGAPTPAHEGELRAVQRYRFWADLKVRLLLSTGLLVVGWPPYVSWVLGLWAGAVVWCLPTASVLELAQPWARHLNALAAVVLVVQVCAARRRTVVAGEVSPGVTFWFLHLDWARVRKAFAAWRTACGTRPGLARLTVVLTAAGLAIATVRTAARLTASQAVAAGLAVGGTVGGAFAGRLAASAMPPAAVPADAPMLGLTVGPTEPPAGLSGASVVLLLLGAVGGFAVVVWPWWVRRCLGHWRILVKARREWAPRWQMIKHDPAPRLVNRRQVGAATVDTFTAPGSAGALAYWPLAAKITPALGAGQQIAVLSVPNVDSDGVPKPGTRHPLDFDVVAWPADQTPDVTDPHADPDEVALYLQCAMVWTADADGYARPILHQAHPIALPSAQTDLTPRDTDSDAATCKDAAETADSLRPAENNRPVDGSDDPPLDTRQAWAVRWLLPDGPPWEYVRSALAAPLAARLGCEVLVDHRSQVMYVGGLTDGTTRFNPASGVEPEALTKLQVEDEWNRRWADALKRDANPPRPDHATRAEATLPGGQVVHRQAFVTRQGVDPSEFFGLEAKVAATLAGAPFVAITGWPSPGRAGERHAQAFTVYWSDQPVPPNPDQLTPPPATTSRQDDPRPSSAQQWVLAGRISEAFKAARLAKPEAYQARCLTRPAASGHIWRVALRLYGGVTLADVRTAAGRIRQALGSQWLRVEDSPEGCALVAGTSPATLDPANLRDPARDRRYLAALDWEQAFLDAKVHGVGHTTPALTHVDQMPHNPQVKVLDFTLPEGLSFTQIKAARPKLETASKNAFVDIARHPSGRADQFRMLASEVNPMPEQVPFDFTAAEPGTDGYLIPFATGLTGEPVHYDNAKDAMVLVSGQQGSGKSVALQNLLYGAAIRRWGIWLADPSKDGVDFNFARPYATAFATTVWQAQGMMKAVYAEVGRRKKINAQHSCGNYRDLPDEVRYPHQLLMLDEFTSLMIPEPLPKLLDDSAESAQELEYLKAVNAAKATIATYVAKMVREARSTGFTVILATQALKADTIAKMPNSNDLKDNLSRMILGRASPGQLMSALKQPAQAPPQPDAIPQGRGLYEGSGRTAEHIQVWFEPDQTTFTDQIAARRGPLHASEKLDMTAMVEPIIDIDGAPIHQPTGGGPTAPVTVNDLGTVVLAVDDDIDWDALTASAAANQPDLAPTAADSGPDRTAGATESDGEHLGDEHRGEGAGEVGATAEAGSVVVGEHVVWDDIDPSAWEPDESEHGWTEIDALLGFLDAYSHVNQVEWNDPRLDEQYAEATHRDNVTALLATLGVDLTGRDLAPSHTSAHHPPSAGPPDEFQSLPIPPDHLVASDEF